jgi:hypothetical protein
MPSRTFTLAVVLFWLATAVWFFDRDVWPHLRPGEAPPYTIELADEATRQAVPVRWALSRNGQSLGTLRTTFRYHDADDTFELTAASPELTLLRTAGVLDIKVLNLSDQARVTREGELRAMQSDITVRVQGPLVGGERTAQIAIAAEVRNGRLERRCRVEVPGLGTFEPALEPVPPTRGSVLNPLHPVPRLTGLRPGQHWRQPLVDPRSDTLKAVLANLPGGESASGLAARGPQVLLAEVRPATEALTWEGGEHACWVVEYRGDLEGEEFRARTWVRVSDGLVLRQEAEAHRETLELQRE